MRLAIGILAIFSTVLMCGQVSINEFMSLNVSSISDEDGDFSDWIELYNAGPLPIDLSGWSLSDDLDQPFKWQFAEAEIPAGGFLLLFASDKDRSGPGELHTNFKISASGEDVVLSNPQGVLVHWIPASTISADESLGSVVDGDSQNPIRFTIASPGSSNSEGVPLSYTPDVLEFSVPGGFYSDDQELTLISEQEAMIRYTLDGSIPTSNSALYTSPLSIDDRQGEADVISLINTGIDWQEPRRPGEKATVIRAASFQDGQRISPVHTETYFISERFETKYRDVPVLSISLNADSLFSQDRGIFVAGDNWTSDWPTGTGNYFMGGRDWEREMCLEYFDEDHVKSWSQTVGGRVHGNTSRYHPQKSIRLYARSEYGNSYFDQKFFEQKDIDRFKRVILRNASTDFAGTMFKDNLCVELVKEMDIDYMAWQTCVVFINGEYWGVYSIRERIDEHYLEQNHDIDPEAVDLLEQFATVEQGSNEAYLQLFNYLENSDLSLTEDYEYVSSLIDIESFIDYYVAQLYLANFDWPGANIRYWKSHADSSQWRWIFYDCDRCMVLTDYDHLIDFTQEDNQYNSRSEWTFLVFNKLIKNPGFKQQFVQRFFFHLSTTFESARALDELDELVELYTPLMVDHIDRWNYPASMNLWNESIQELRGFIIRRPAIMVQQVMEYLGEQYVLYPNPVSGSQQFVNLDMEHSEEVRVRFEIYASSGQFIKRIDLDSSTTEGHPQLSLSGMEPGLYFVRIHYGSLLFIERLMVE